MASCVMDTNIMDTCSLDKSAWVTQLESPKGVKEEVQQARMVN